MVNGRGAYSATAAASRSRSRSNAAGSTSLKQIAGSTGSTSPSTRVRSSTDMRAPPEWLRTVCCQSVATSGSENAGHFCEPSGKSAGDSGRATSPTVGPIPTASGRRASRSNP